MYFWNLRFSFTHKVPHKLWTACFSPWHVYIHCKMCPGQMSTRGDSTLKSKWCHLFSRWFWTTHNCLISLSEKKCAQWQVAFQNCNWSSSRMSGSSIDRTLAFRRHGHGFKSSNCHFRSLGKTLNSHYLGLKSSTSVLLVIYIYIYIYCI